MSTHAIFAGDGLDSEIFWGEIAPCEHLLQLYDDGEVFLDSLEHFVGSGLLAGEGVIVIATEPHLDALRMRLLAAGHDMGRAARAGLYLPVSAEATLATFMVADWPDEALFEVAVHELVTRARARAPRVRAFGEMVALLWTQQNYAATVRLEQLWQALCRKEKLSLLCAYPASGFTKHAAVSVGDICSLHSRVVGNRTSG